MAVYTVTLTVKLTVQAGSSWQAVEKGLAEARTLLSFQSADRRGWAELEPVKPADAERHQ